MQQDVNGISPGDKFKSLVKQSVVYHKGIAGGFINKGVEVEVGEMLDYYVNVNDIKTGETYHVYWEQFYVTFERLDKDTEEPEPPKLNDRFQSLGEQSVESATNASRNAIGSGEVVEYKGSEFNLVSVNSIRNDTNYNIYKDQFNFGFRKFPGGDE